MLKRQLLSAVCFSLFASSFMIGTAHAQTTGANLPTPSELSVWQAAQTSDTPDAYRAYLSQFPTGTYAALAATRTAPPLLNDMLPVPPRPDNAQVQVEMAAARSAWDNAAWQRVKTANTHAAYREYLLHLPVGEHSLEALSAYQTTLPAAPARRFAQCTTADKDAEVTQRMNLRRAYPDYALERWTDGIVIGKNHIDYTGKVLGTTIEFTTNEAMFSLGARLSGAQMRYAPALVDCANSADTGTLVISYKTGDLPYENRENDPAAAAIALPNTQVRGVLGPQTAQLYSFTPSPGMSVYEVEMVARFPHLLTLVDNTGRYSPEFRGNMPLISNKMFVTSSATPILLRLSAPDKPNSKRKNMGNYRFQIRQLYNNPDFTDAPPAIGTTP